MEKDRTILEPLIYYLTCVLLIYNSISCLRINLWVTSPPLIKQWIIYFIVNQYFLSLVSAQIKMKKRDTPLSKQQSTPCLGKGE